MSITNCIDGTYVIGVLTFANRHATGKTKQLLCQHNPIAGLRRTCYPFATLANAGFRPNNNYVQTGRFKKPAYVGSATQSPLTPRRHCPCESRCVDPRPRPESA